MNHTYNVSAQFNGMAPVTKTYQAPVQASVNVYVAQHPSCDPYADLADIYPCYWEAVEEASCPQMANFINNGVNGWLVWPWINAMVPLSAMAGNTNVPVSIYGSGFAYNASVAVIDDQENLVPITVTNVHVVNPSHIDAVFSVPTNFTPGDYGVIVIDGTLPDGVGSGSNVWPFTIYPPIAPQIMFSGQNITGQTQTVVVGQQVALTASYTIPAGTGVTVSSQSWTVGGTTVGSYTASDSSAFTTAANFSAASTTFYWTVPSTAATVKFTLNLSNGQSPSATATFTVSGVSSPSMSVQNFGHLSINQLSGCAATSGGPYLVYGNVSGPAPGCTGVTTGTPGIQFTAAGTPPTTGGFSFVQLINSDTRTYTSGSGTLTCSHTSGLDFGYPYGGHATATSANDSPQAPLPNTYTSASRSFNATMYLLWRPNTTNSIPVPLGSITWQFSGSTTQTAGNWGTPSGSGGPVGGFTAANGAYPTWSSAATEACQ